MKTFRLLPLLAGALAFGSSLSAADAVATPSADSALLLLQQGNDRFVHGVPLRPDQTPARRAEVAQGQHPFAVVLTCADSRVSPELYFDQGLGDLFVLRNAGNLIDDHVLGSIEYAVEHLHAPLIVVAGHQRCGAVSAAVAGGHAPGFIGSIVATIEPHLKHAAGEGADRIDQAVRTHARATADDILRNSALIRQRVAAGEVKIVAAYYSLDTGRIELLP
jgi:carbonic anhydrase